MTAVVSHNIMSPLGLTTEENLQAVLEGRIGIALHEESLGIPHPFMASLFREEDWARLMVDGFTRFESLVVRSVTEALKGVTIDLERTLLVLSSTKGNIELMMQSTHVDARLNLADSAARIANHLHLKLTPVVCCNACISGVSAQLLASRMLQIGECDYAIVCGADVQSRFIVSGFQSLQCTSDAACRPFDIERNGLNLGEAAATLILSGELAQTAWCLAEGCVRNDGYNISTPSRTAEGMIHAINYVTKDVNPDSIGVVNAHGTATLYNDQMESVAVSHTALADVPVNGYKGVFGHTMGASGVLETVLTLATLDMGLVLPTRGYEECGVSGKMDLVKEVRPTQKNSFIKMIAGFGGCNGVLRFTKGRAQAATQGTSLSSSYTIQSTVHITPDAVEVNGNKIACEKTGRELLTYLYKTHVGDYTRFYKMDPMSRLVFIANELLCSHIETGDGEHVGVMLFNHSSSVMADRMYMKSIEDKENYFPSPSDFVYTLPNIAIGEIAIRKHYQGETEFYLLPQKDEQCMQAILQSAFLDTEMKSLITGWVNYEDESYFEAQLKLITRI